MPYNFVKPNRDPGAVDDDEEMRIQQELISWRLQMREERQRRLVAAAAKAERAQKHMNPPTAGESSSELKVEYRGEPARHYDPTALQEYRRELNEMMCTLDGGKNTHWYAATTAQQPRRIKQKGVIYHEARSVLRGYINRPTPSIPQSVRKAPNGALQAYRDALAVSTRAYCDAAGGATPSSWHKRPLRSISACERRGGTLAPAPVATTRSTTLRKRHTEHSHTGQNYGRDSPLKASKAHRKGQTARLEHFSPSKLGLTKAYRDAMQKGHQPYHVRTSQSREELSQYSDSSSLCRGGRKSVTQPMAPSSPLESPQPRQPTGGLYARRDEKFAASDQTYMDAPPAAEAVDVSPLTPALGGCNTSIQGEERPRREPSPLLTDLLSKLALPAPSLYRPDLFQGHARADNGPAARSMQPQPRLFEDTTSLERNLFSDEAHKR
ncbi:hypothetical protein DQ04_00071170 [Trypanosoma grayi]|uniref:hypothetical protein n=1 Tax=Trypanosoma grayi TaxID=71804 RepID=UPI0004F48ABD|nr:hypothetical protein DQ04_00071170 [Trypanosoma grayi]KEG15449.1 hypothetical protein DQ04_00071170 [Trypanosoma grayi]